MITLNTQNLGKRYIRQWIFRGLEISFKQGEPWAVTGPNGSGKSTLLKVLSGFQPATEGTLQLVVGSRAMAAEEIYKHISIAAPYLELIEDLMLGEMLRFHFSFKRIADGSSLETLADRMYLAEAWHKPVKHFSSGMKQRLKLGLAFYADSPVLFLDEPTTNLDAQGQTWYEQELSKVLDRKLVLIASNQPQEYKHCTQQLFLPDWKSR